MAAAPVAAPAAGLEPILLKEVINSSHRPDVAELRDAAEWLGMDLECDEDLLWLAEEFILAPLPKPWRAYADRNLGEVFYFNKQTGESTWHHPCDEIYRQICKEEKRKRVPLKVLTVCGTAIASDSGVHITCIEMSGDCVAEFICEPSQTFSGFKTLLASELSVDIALLRLVLPSAVLADDDAFVALCIKPHELSE